MKKAKSKKNTTTAITTDPKNLSDQQPAEKIVTVKKMNDKTENFNCSLK